MLPFTFIDSRISLILRFSNSSIKIGTTSLHTPSELLANLLAVLPYIATRIPNAHSSFSNVQSLHLKTSTSTSLPIYNSKLEDRFTGFELTQEEQKAKDEKLAEKKKLKEEKEQRAKERSATKDGKGRLEKKRTVDEEETEETEETEKAEVEETVVTEAAPAKKVEEESKRPSKKAKKDKKVKA